MENVMQALIVVRSWVAARSEKGQGTLEYVGMVIVAAILVVAVLEVTNTIDLGSVFQTAIESVTNFGG